MNQLFNYTFIFIIYFLSGGIGEIATPPDKPIVDQVQTFCFNPDIPPRVSQLSIKSSLNGNSLYWFETEFGGTALDPSTELVDQKKYYATLVNNLGEESARTETKAQLLDPIIIAADEICYGDQTEISVTNIPSTPQDFIKANPQLVMFLNDPENKTAYFLKEEAMGWTQAYDYIESFGESAAMYVINSKEEEDKVFYALSNLGLTGTNEQHFWLGLRQFQGQKPNNAIDKDWYWIDGRPLTDELAHWNANEPNDCCGTTGVEDGEEDYGQFDFYVNDGSWNDMTNSADVGGRSWPIFEFNGSTAVRWGSYDQSGNEVVYQETSSILSLTLTKTTTFFIEVETNGVFCRREHTVKVNPLPEIQPLSALEFCDNNLDGDDTNGSVSGIDLTVQNEVALGKNQAAEDFTIQYFPTEIDAISSTNELKGLYDFIPDQGYIPASIASKTIYIKMQNNSTGCISIDSFDVVVNPLPIANEITDVNQCDDTKSGSDTDGIVNSWDLTSQSAKILGTQDPDLFKVSYHLTQNDADDLNKKGISFPFTNTEINSQKIFVRVLNTQTQCYRSTTSFNLIVNPLPVLSQTSITYEQCDDDDKNDGISLFNLHSWESSFSENYQNETFEFYTDSSYDPSSLIENSQAYYNQAFAQTVYVKIMSEFGCSRFAQLNLKVAASLIPDDFMMEYLNCDDTDPFNQKGLSTFPASVIDEIKTSLINTDPKFSAQAIEIDFFYSKEDALTTTNGIKEGLSFKTQTPNSQEIWALITNKNVNTIECLGLKQVATLYVDPVAIPYPITIDRQCDGNSDLDLDSEDGKFPFDSSTVDEQLIQNQEGVTAYYYAEDGSFIGNSFPKLFESTTQTISVYLEKETLHPNLSRINPDCKTTTSFDLIVDDSPQLPKPITFRICDNGDSDIDGIGEFDTTGLHEQLVNNQDLMTIKYLDQNSNELFDVFPNSYTTENRIIDVVLKNPLNGDCTAFTQLNFIVDELPVFEVEQSIILCYNIGFINIGLISKDSRNYSYSWSYTSPNGLSEPIYETTNRIDATRAGIYELTLTTTDGSFCQRTRPIEVNASNIASVKYEDLTITDLQYGNVNQMSLDTLNLGIGDYEFSIDQNSYQDQPEFGNLTPGIHQLYINDKNNCGEIYLDFSIIGFYRFFTPNSDGYNDYWNVFGIDENHQSNSEVYIFDRYGKLIAQIDPLSQGWDGTINGKPLPDTDYWFRLKLEDGRTAKGHFSLIRGY